MHAAPKPTGEEINRGLDAYTEQLQATHGGYYPSEAARAADISWVDDDLAVFEEEQRLRVERQRQRQEALAR